MTEPWVLCVDDEPRILEGLELQLSFDYTVRTATGGEEALRLLDAHPDCAVVISDMRMPGMNGARFLSRARHTVPDTTRMLLTGYSDVTDAIAAINEGGIFRFLTKPTSPDDLKAAVADAVRQWELIRSERVLLEQTLHGAAEALIEALEIASPEVFSRARRIEGAARHVAIELGLAPVWEIALAGLLLRLGWIAVPADTTAKWLAGEEPDEVEAGMIDATYATSARLVGRIARLEGVAEIIGQAHQPSGAVDAATVVRAAAEFDELRRQGHSPARAAKDLDGACPASILHSLQTWAGASEELAIIEVTVSELQPGMTAETDILNAGGNLLVPAGTDLTETVIQRLRNFARSQGVDEPIAVATRLG